MKLKSFVAAFLLTLAASVFAVGDGEPVANLWEVLPLASAESSTLPDQSPARWGQLDFREKEAWHQRMFQPDADGVSFTPPSLGFDKKNWQQYHGAWMRARKYVPSEWYGQHVFFAVDGLKCRKATLFVNGKEAAGFEDRRGRADIADFVKFGDRNEFLLLLDGGKKCDFMLLKGPPVLVPRGSESVDDIRVNTSWREKKLTVDITVSAEKPKTIAIIAKVLDKAGKEVKLIRETRDVPAGTTVVSSSVDWKDPIPWELGRGYLYTLKTVVRFGAKDSVCPDVRFGFREIWREGRKIFLNGHEQNLRTTGDPGIVTNGVKALTKLGYNTVDFRPRKEAEMVLSDAQLECFSTNGVGVIAPVAAFDRNFANGIAKSGSWRDDIKRESAVIVRRYRNWPCFLFNVFGADAYVPKHPGDPAHFGDEDGEAFPKTVNELADAARTVNSNVLYSSDSDGALGDLESATLAYDWAPVAEWEDRFSAWAGKAQRPFRVRGLRTPGEKDWYRDGRDCVTEILASFYGDRAYELEPDEIRFAHRSNTVACAAHPLVGEFGKDFLTRVGRAWRTVGVNGGIDWSDSDFAKTANAQFLGWIAGSPRVTDRRHAYEAGATVEKQAAMLWDGFRRRKISVQWKVGGKKKALASGLVEKTLEPGSPVLVPIRFKAPAVKAKARYTLNVKFLDEKGKTIGTDGFAFDVQPEVFGPPPYNTLCTAKTRVIEPFSLKSAADLPWEAIRNGLKVLVLPQSAEVMKSLGFEIEEVAPRQLCLRDFVSPAFAKLDEDDLREWYGQPRTEQIAKCGDEPYGNFVKAKGPQAPRWNYNNALCGFLLRTPDSVGYLPVIEGGFDGNASAVIRRFVGKGEIVFSTLSTIDRFGLNELKGAPVRDPSARKTQVAICDDLLQPAGPAHVRKVYPSGDYAVRLAKSLGIPTLEMGILPTSVVLCGPDSELSVNDIVSAVSRGSNVLIVDNRRLAEGLGFKVAEADPSAAVYRVNADPANPDLRSIGRNLLRFRASCPFARLSDAPKGWTIDADGMFASRTYREGGKVFVTQLDPFRLEDAIKAEKTYVNEKGKSVPMTDKVRKENLRRVDLTITRHRQFIARLLTLLGVGSGDGPLYSASR